MPPWVLPMPTPTPSEGHYSTPHGLGNAAMLPYVIHFNMPAAEAKYADIARMLDLDGTRDADLAAELVYEILRLSSLVGITGLEDALGDNLDDFRKNIDTIAKDAFADPCVATNPRKVLSPAETKRIYQKALEKHLVHCWKTGLRRLSRLILIPTGQFGSFSVYL